VTATIDATNKINTTVYDADGRVTATIDPLGNISTTVYDAIGEVTATIDPKGNTTTYSFDVAGRQTSVTTPDLKTNTTVYDLADRVTNTIDDLGNVTTYVYDNDGNLINTIDPINKTSTVNYDAAGNETSSTDALGRTTTTVYDSDNRVTTTIDPLGNISTTQYDAAGRTIETIDARGNITSYAYDIDGRQTSVTDPLNHTTTTVYNAAGQTIATVDQLGNRTSYGYDTAGNRTTVTDPLNHTTTTAYDSDNRATAVTDPLGHTTTTVYNSAGQVSNTIDALGFTTTYHYDKDGNRTALIDASGNITTWSYNSLGQQTGVTNPLNQTSTMAYDGDGRLASETDATHRRTDFTYDSDGRKLTEKWYDSNGTLTQTTNWSYDAAGEMLTAQNPNAIYTMSYDGDGRVSSVKEPFGLVLTFGYDAVGNRTSVQDSKGGYTTVTFDANNRQLSQQTAGNGVSAMRFDYAYDARGMTTNLTRYSDLAGNNVVGTTAYLYDAAGNETNLKSTSGTGSVLANYTYTYDAANRLASKVENGATTSYSYDADNQLTQDGSSTYSYNATGNRTDPGYSTGTGNRLSTDGTWTYTYDANGNEIAKSQGMMGALWSYTYDNRNELVTATYSTNGGMTISQRLTYVYDALGNQIERDAWNGSTTTTTRYGLDGYDPAKPTPIGNENYDTWVELDGSNNVVTRRENGTGFDQAIARQNALGTVGWYVDDQQGSVRQVIDNSANVLATSTFSGTGVLTAGSLSDDVGYTGMRWGSMESLYSDNARFLDPSTDRFLSTDIKFPDTGANPYDYAGNDSTNATDPSGEAIVADTREQADAIVERIQQLAGITLDKPRQYGDRWIIDPVQPTDPRYKELQNHFANTGAAYDRGEIDFWTLIARHKLFLASMFGSGMNLYLNPSNDSLEGLGNEQDYRLSLWVVDNLSDYLSRPNTPTFPPGWVENNWKKYRDRGPTMEGPYRESYQTPFNAMTDGPQFVAGPGLGEPFHRVPANVCPAVVMAPTERLWLTVPYVPSTAENCPLVEGMIDMLRAPARTLGAGADLVRQDFGYTPRFNQHWIDFANGKISAKERDDLIYKDFLTTALTYGPAAVEGMAFRGGASVGVAGESAAVPRVRPSFGFDGVGNGILVEGKIPPRYWVKPAFPEAGQPVPVAIAATATTPTLWINIGRDPVAEEVAAAATVGVFGPTPITKPASLAEIGKGGKPFKWVVSQEGELLGLPIVDPGDVVKHTVATGGKPVQAAGIGRFQDNKLIIDKLSGHHKPDPGIASAQAPSLTIAKQKFEAAGFQVEIVDDVKAKAGR
jgi:RHS repeat-associated protein